MAMSLRRPSLEVGPVFVQFAARIVLLAGVLTAGIAHHQIAIAPVLEFIYGLPFLAYVTSTFHVWLSPWNLLVSENGVGLKSTLVDSSVHLPLNGRRKVSAGPTNGLTQQMIRSRHLKLNAFCSAKHSCPTQRRRTSIEIALHSQIG